MAYSIEQYANLATTTLSGAITSGSTVLTVASSGTTPFFFPTFGQYRIRIDDEFLLVTGVSGLTWGVTRGIETCTVSGHASGATVTADLTAGALTAVAGQTCLDGAFGTMPSGAVVGRLMFPNNSFFIARDPGSGATGLWQGYGPIFPCTPPIISGGVNAQVSSGFAWINQGNASGSVVNGGVYLWGPGLSGANWRFLKQNAPSTGVSYTVTLGFIPFYAPSNNFAGAMGLILRNSVNGRFVTLEWQPPIGTGNAAMAVNKWTNPTTFSASYTVSNSIYNFRTGSMLFVRMVYDTTNLYFQYGFDGQNFFQIFQVGKNDFLTVDEIGFGIDAENQPTFIALTALHFASNPPPLSA